MRLWTGRLLIAAACLFSTANGLAAPSDDPAPKARAFSCPLGGAKFEQEVAYPHFPLVQFPDGSHLGDEFVDAQIPQCPGSGLLILPDFAKEPAGGEAIEYHDYSADELSQLPSLLADPEWKTITGQSRHQRAYWLASRLGRPASDRLQLIVRAQWATSANPTLHRLALEQLVRDGPRLIDEARLDPPLALANRFLVINALRELGRFSEAKALLDEATKSGTMLVGPVDPDAMFDPGSYAEAMRTAIEAGDDDRFALDLLPDSFARRVCSGSAGLAYRGKHTTAGCTARASRAAELSDLFDKVEALKADRPALDASCRSTPEGARDKVLARACASVQHERDWEAGGQLAEKDPTGVAAVCEAKADEDRSTIEASACSSYDVYRGSVLTALLTALDPATYDKVCRGEAVASTMQYGCDSAFGTRANARARMLLIDRPALKALCQARKPDDPDYALQMACGALAERGEPYWANEQAPTVGSDPMSRAALPFVEAALRKAIAEAGD